MAVQLQLCGLLPPGLVQYCPQHFCVKTYEDFNFKLERVKRRERERERERGWGSWFDSHVLVKIFLFA